MKPSAIKTFLNNFKPFLDVNAWVMVLVGLFVFCLRIPLPTEGLLNLPVAFTVLQTAALMFALAGLQIMISKCFWPGISLWHSIRDVHEGRAGSATVLLGLFLFNGLCILATVFWLTSALGSGISAR